jgi:hypothetical protein
MAPILVWPSRRRADGMTRVTPSPPRRTVRPWRADQIWRHGESASLLEVPHACLYDRLHGTTASRTGWPPIGPLSQGENPKRRCVTSDSRSVLATRLPGVVRLRSSAVALPPADGCLARRRRLHVVYHVEGTAGPRTSRPRTADPRPGPMREEDGWTLFFMHLWTIRGVAAADAHRRHERSRPPAREAR